MMRRFLTLSALLVAIVLVAGNVWAAEAEANPAGTTMQEVDLDEADFDEQSHRK